MLCLLDETWTKIRLQHLRRKQIKDKEDYINRSTKVYENMLYFLDKKVINIMHKRRLALADILSFLNDFPNLYTKI